MEVARDCLGSLNCHNFIQFPRTDTNRSIEANVRLADQLTEANAKLREELIEVKVELHNVREGRGLHQEELEAEKQAFTQELQQLQRSIRSELAAQTISRYSSQASSVPSSSNLWEEHDQVHALFCVAGTILCDGLTWAEGTESV
eukprot:symbB.v1.2.008977.t1/scaffold506.1/size199467/2